MRAPTLGGAVAAFLISFGAEGASAAPRVYSLDQCADQYVLALSPRATIVGLSKRADDADAYFRRESRGLPQGRATTEAVLAAKPDVVVRYWGGDQRLSDALRRRGVRVVKIEDTNDFDGLRANVRNVASALGEAVAGERLIARMDAQLARSRGAWRGAGALYYTPGGFTAGGGTLIDAMLRAAGLTNLAGGEGFHPVSLERLVTHPPAALVPGFFDNAVAAFQRWSPGRHRVARRLAAERTIVALPGSILGCPAWFAADGSLALARARR
jgi:iron complex transport system substrate-binding protein